MVITGCFVTTLLWESSLPAFDPRVGAVESALAVWVLAAMGIIGSRRTDLVARRLGNISARHIALALSLACVTWALSAWLPNALGGLLLMAAVLHVSLAFERPLVAFLSIVTVGILTLLPLEGVLVMLRHSLSLTARPLTRDLVRRLYRIDWRLVHFDPECAQYDPILFYTLRPGGCTFSNTEYRTSYRINRLGLRDDEESLEGPSILVTGDSYSMGWGVEQDETYASRLEQTTGLKVLNTGIASYGTARQFLMLQRVDWSQVRYLILQYCANDFEENQAYLESGGRLPERDPSRYQQILQSHEFSTGYYPGKYVTFIFPGLKQAVFRKWENRTEKRSEEERRSQEVMALVNVIESCSVDLSNVRLIFFEINAYHHHRKWVIPMLQEALNRSAAAPPLQRAVVIDMMERLSLDHFYPLDGHLNAAGHAKIAQELLPFIGH